MTRWTRSFGRVERAPAGHGQGQVSSDRTRRGCPQVRRGPESREKARSGGFEGSDARVERWLQSRRSSGCRASWSATTPPASESRDAWRCQGSQRKRLFGVCEAAGVKLAAFRFTLGWLSKQGASRLFSVCLRQGHREAQTDLEAAGGGRAVELWLSNEASLLDSHRPMRS